MNSRPVFVDPTTQASNQARASISRVRWFNVHPTWPLFWVGLILAAIVMRYPHPILLVAILVAISVHRRNWRRLREHFFYGNANPGLVVSTNPTLIAVATDLSKGYETAPVVKIIPCPLRKIMGVPPAIGARLATVALYRRGADPASPKWADFNPIPLEVACDAQDDLDRIMRSFPPERWQELEAVVANLSSKKPGLYELPASSASQTASSRGMTRSPHPHNEQFARTFLAQSLKEHDLMFRILTSENRLSLLEKAWTGLGDSFASIASPLPFTDFKVFPSRHEDLLLYVFDFPNTATPGEISGGLLVFGPVNLAELPSSFDVVGCRYFLLELTSSSRVVITEVKTEGQVVVDTISEPTRGTFVDLILDRCYGMKPGAANTAEDEGRSEEAAQRWFATKSRLMEEMLGPEHDHVMHAVIPWPMGALDLYYYPKAVNGTAIATKELSPAPNAGPANTAFTCYELCVFTKLSLSLAEAGNAESSFGRMHHHLSLVLNGIAHYAAEATLNGNETCEFPAEVGPLAGRCFIFAEYAQRTSEIAWRFGILAIVEIFRSEMDYARASGGGKLIALLKQAGHYPFSDLDRAPVV